MHHKLAYKNNNNKILKEKKRKNTYNSIFIFVYYYYKVHYTSSLNAIVYQETVIREIIAQPLQIFGCY